MITSFPIDAYANDYSSHLARVVFLDKYGLYNIVPNWYNGAYTLLTFYTPLWYLSALPLYWITKDIELAGYLSLIFLYILGFLFLYLFGREAKLSKFKRILFFLFFFVNPIAIGYFLRLGKLPEMFGWVWFFLIALLIFRYRERIIDKWFFLIVPFYVLIFYTHILVFIVASLFLLMLFVYKNNFKERVFIIISVIFILALTSFFWIPFLKNAQGNLAGTYFSLQWLISPGNITDKIVSFIIPITFWILFYFYWKSNGKLKKELVFFSVPLVFSFLYLTRIAVFIPLFNRPTPDSYHFFFIFFMSYMVLKMKVENLPSFLQRYFYTILLVIVIIGVVISLIFTPLFQPHSENIQETFSLLKEVDGKLILLKTPPEVFRGAVYSYGAIYYNISTPSGWEPINITKEYQQQLSLPSIYIEERNCGLLKESLVNLDTNNVITFNKYCNYLEECGFSLIDRK